MLCDELSHQAETYVQAEEINSSFPFPKQLALLVIVKSSV